MRRVNVARWSKICRADVLIDCLDVLSFGDVCEQRAGE